MPKASLHSYQYLFNMRQNFRVNCRKDTFLALLAIALVTEIYYYFSVIKRSDTTNKNIARVISSIGFPPSDLTAIRQAHLTRESIVKLRENSCKIPILDPFAPEMTRFFKPYKLSCQKAKKFYFKSHVEQHNSMIVTQNENPFDLLRCCYEQLFFEKSDPYKPVNFDTDPRCVIFAENKTIVPSDSEYLIIKCWDSTMKLENDPAPTHHELLFYVPKPSSELLHTKITKLKSQSEGNEKPLNVIILGFDQVSRANFIRLMGNTFEYLRTDLGAIDLQGFNKMGDATLNNTLAMLTGHDFGSIKNSGYFLESDPYFDECPWIWKNFSDKGYITAYADDYTSVFNYRFNGFKTQPTDYYIQPFLKWYGQNKRGDKFGSSYDCIGNELLLDLLQDQARKVAAAVGTHPYFHFMWISRIHENPGYPALADKGTLETLKYFQSTGVLNRSLVILISDHGWRAGSIMMEPQSRLENRLSFAFLLLPQWFQEKYSLAYDILRENQYKLTSPYDIHKTLQDILNPVSKLSNEVILERSSPSGSKGVSLFLPISEKRSCADAGIDEEWCACTHYQPFAADSPEAIQLANYAVTTINSWLLPYQSCKQYSLNKVISAEVNKSSDMDITAQGIPLEKESHQFRISFEVSPRGAKFEVTIFTQAEYWQDSGDSQEQRISMSTEVFRLNVYESSKCMKLYSLKKICTCA